MTAWHDLARHGIPNGLTDLMLAAIGMRWTANIPRHITPCLLSCRSFVSSFLSLPLLSSPLSIPWIITLLSLSLFLVLFLLSSLLQLLLLSYTLSRCFSLPSSLSLSPFFSPCALCQLNTVSMARLHLVLLALLISCVGITYVHACGKFIQASQPLSRKRHPATDPSHIKTQGELATLKNILCSFCSYFLVYSQRRPVGVIQSHS